MLMYKEEKKKKMDGRTESVPSLFRRYLLPRNFLVIHYYSRCLWLALLLVVVDTVSAADLVVSNAASVGVPTCDPAQCGSWDCAAWCTCYVPNAHYTACMYTLWLVEKCECSAKPAAVAEHVEINAKARTQAKPLPPPEQREPWDDWIQGAPRRTDVAIVMADDRTQIPLWRASIAQKRAYAERHGYAFSLSGGDSIVDPARATYPTGLRTKAERHAAYRNGRTDAIAFGRLTEFDGWNKIGALIASNASIPEGGWLWFVDSDVIIMDMERSLDGLIAHAEGDGMSALFVDWQCGDGMNSGSVMVRNNEWGRSWWLRVRDSRVVWQNYYVGDQGAFWILMANIPSTREHILFLPPRTINARPKECQCAADHFSLDNLGEAYPGPGPAAAGRLEMENRVYWREGDFLKHYAGMSQSAKFPDMKVTIAEDLAMTGSYPCPPPCSLAALEHVSLGPRLGGADSTTNMHREWIPRSHRVKVAKQSALHILFVSSAEDALLSNAAQSLLGDTLRKHRIIRRTGHAYYRENGVAVPRSAKVMFMPYEQGNLPSIGEYVRRRGDDDDDDDGELVFSTADGWAGLILACETLTKWQKEPEAREEEGLLANEKQRWLLLIDDSPDDATTAGTLLLLAATMREPLLDAPHLVLSARDCTGPLLIRDSEFARSLLRRLAVGILARRNRIEIKFGHWGHTSFGAEDRGNFAQTLCLFLKRDPTARSEVRWI